MAEHTNVLEDEWRTLQAQLFQNLVENLSRRTMEVTVAKDGRKSRDEYTECNGMMDSVVIDLVFQCCEKLFGKGSLDHYYDQIAKDKKNGGRANQCVHDSRPKECPKNVRDLPSHPNCKWDTGKMRKFEDCASNLYKKYCGKTSK